jgi:hypothetical protein
MVSEIRKMERFLLIIVATPPTPCLSKKLKTHLQFSIPQYSLTAKTIPSMDISGIDLALIVAHLIAI